MDVEILQRIQDELLNQDNLFSHYLKGMMRRKMIREMDSEILANLIYGQVFIAAFRHLVDRDGLSDQNELNNRINDISNFFVTLVEIRGE